MDIQKIIMIILFTTIGTRFMYFLCHFLAQIGCKKRLQKAIDNGHVVTAYLKKTLHDSSEEGRDDLIYEFEYKGRKYKYRTWIDGRYSGDYEITLYFKRNPFFAKEKQIFDGVEGEWLLTIPIMAIFLWIII